MSTLPHQCGKDSPSDKAYWTEGKEILQRSFQVDVHDDDDDGDGDDDDH